MTPNPVLKDTFTKATERPHSQSKLDDPRFRLHEIASRILTDPVFDTKEESKKRESAQAVIDYPKSTKSEKSAALGVIYPRVTKCQKIPFMFGDTSEHVDGTPLRVSKDHGAYSFQGLFSCGSVWSCPICSSRIAQVRCNEVATAFKIWRSIGEENGKTHTQIMVSLTVPHHFDQSINSLRSSFMKTRVIMKNQQELKKNPTFKTWGMLCEKYGIKGTLSAIETTYGFNGWHPHSHDILFIDRELTNDELDEFKAYLTTAWIYACRRTKVKMTPDQEYYMFQKSVHVRKAPTAEQYVSKFGLVMDEKQANDEYENHKDILNPGWGAAQELTKSHIKKSRGDKGYTPWDFLRIIDEFPEDRKLYLRFGRLFREYSRAFFGCRQLFWSKGFKDEIGITNYILSDVPNPRS